MTSALARRNSGVQAGSVDGATSTAPAGMASPAAGSRATKAGPRGRHRRASCRRRDRFRHPPRGAQAGQRAAVAFLHHVRIFRARPLLQLCPAPRGAPGRRLCRQRAVGQGQQFLDAQVEHIVGRGQPPRPAQRSPAPARSARRRRRSRPARCARPRAGGSPTARRRSAAAPAALPARQRRVQRPPGRRAAPGAHAARPGRRRSGSARCPADNPALRASADDADRFRRRRDGRSAPEVREGAAKRAVWRQRVAPVRAAPVGARSQASAAASSRQRGQIHQRVALGGRHAGRAASHERGGQRVALARAGRLDQFQQFRQGAAGRALQEEQVVGGQQRGELLAQPSAQRRGVLGQGFPAQARARAACRGSPVLAASRMGMARRL